VKAWVFVAVVHAAMAKSKRLVSGFDAAAAAFIRPTSQVIVGKFTLALPLKLKPHASNRRDVLGGGGGSGTRVAASFVLTAHCILDTLRLPPLRCTAFRGQYTSRHRDLSDGKCAADIIRSQPGKVYKREDEVRR
jgi:hypothetical protein